MRACALLARAAIPAAMALAPISAAWAGSSVVGESTVAPAVCGPDPAPAVAAAWGLTCETFVDNFSSLGDIDLNNTRRAGYKWYVNNGWPANTQPVWNTEPASPASMFSVGVGGLTIAPATNSYPVGNASTCVYSTADKGYAGATFAAPFYIDVWATWSNAGSPSDGWPAMFMAPVEWLTGGAGVPWDEIDDFESLFGRTTHEWVITGSTTTRHNSFNDASLAGGSPYGVLVVPPAMNGGTGLEQRYSQDVIDTANNVTFSATGPATGGGSSGNITCEAGTCNPNGTFIPMSTGHYCMILGAGDNGAQMTVAKIAVWQAPNP